MKEVNNYFKDNKRNSNISIDDLKRMMKNRFLEKNHVSLFRIISDFLYRELEQKPNIENKKTQELETNFDVGFVISEKDIGRITDEIFFNDNIIDGFIK